MMSPLGDVAVIARFGDPERARSAAHALRRANRDFITDVVEAFDCVTVFYQSRTYRFVCEWIESMLRCDDGAPAVETPTLLTIPVCYGGDFGPDLPMLARDKSLPESKVVEMHCAGDYVALALGFMPGFAYLGRLDPALHTPRLATPRVSVPAGSVGIGGEYTGVYPFESPGGWNLIGRTPMKLFDLAATPPALIQVGRRVRFHAITPAEFASWK